MMLTKCIQWQQKGTTGKISQLKLNAAARAGFVSLYEWSIHFFPVFLAGVLLQSQVHIKAEPQANSKYTVKIHICLLNYLAHSQSCDVHIPATKSKPKWWPILKLQKFFHVTEKE